MLVSFSSLLFTVFVSIIIFLVRKTFHNTRIRANGNCFQYGKKSTSKRPISILLFYRSIKMKWKKQGPITERRNGHSLRNCSDIQNAMLFDHVFVLRPAIDCFPTFIIREIPICLLTFFVLLVLAKIQSASIIELRNKDFCFRQKTGLSSLQSQNIVHKHRSK